MSGMYIFYLSSLEMLDLVCSESMSLEDCLSRTLPHFGHRPYLTARYRYSITDFKSIPTLGARAGYLIEALISALD